MAAKPQEYVTPTGRMTTNSLEGFSWIGTQILGEES